MTDSGPPPRPQSLTVLRFFAALWVVLFHLHLRTVQPLPTRMREFLGNGACAITLFFVLSGLVLAYGYGRLANNAVIRRF